MTIAIIGFRSVQGADQVTASLPAHPVSISIALRAMITFAAHANGSGISPVAFALSASTSSTDKV
jgi:predicted ATPase